MQQKKRSITLLEIMIVILIIGIIGSVIGYNMRGSLEEAKAFKTREGAKKIRDILTLQMAITNTTPEKVQGKPDEVQSKIAQLLAESGLIADVDRLCKDGWGTKYEIVIQDNGDITIHSSAYDTYLTKKKLPLEPL